ncbi:MAG: Nramp family divalent metal transporter [Halodesulfurarchaeum sp.]
MAEDNKQPDGGTIQESDIYAPPEEGQEYALSVYRPIDLESAETAPETGDYPDLGTKGNFRIADFPRVPKVRHIVGPSAIMLGASLGSGETMFWPHLVAQNTWSLYWAFWVGVLTQFLINTELQRWTIATGESIFSAYHRLHSFWPWFFLVAGFLHVGWPGWGAGAAQVFAAAVLGNQHAWILPGLALFVIIWLSYQIHPVMYNIVEKFNVAAMLVAVAAGIILALVGGALGQLANVPAGAVSFGSLPPEMPIAEFLGGLAYAGAGGLTNLGQGVWSREKGFGMGSYQGRVKNPLIGEEPEVVEDTGFVAPANSLNFQRWKAWWKTTQIEHFLTFVLGLLIVATIMISISTEYAGGLPKDVGAMSMWINYVQPGIRAEAGGLAGALVYIVIFLALFTTEYAILDVFVRSATDIINEMVGRSRGWDVGRVFWAALTLFVVWGMLIIGMRFDKPWILLVIGAAISGFMMWPYNAITLIINTKYLPEHQQPGWGRIVGMWWAVGFFGYFSILLIADQLVNRFGMETFQTSVAIAGSNSGAYVLWAIFVIIQIYVMARSVQYKQRKQGTVEGSDEARGFLA